MLMDFVGSSLQFLLLFDFDLLDQPAIETN